MKVLAFGVTRDIVGNSTVELEQAQLKNVGELRKRLVELYPELGKLNSLAIAVNEQYAEDTLDLSERDVVALIPPVSGG